MTRTTTTTTSSVERNTRTPEPHPTQKEGRDQLPQGDRWRQDDTDESLAWELKFNKKQKDDDQGCGDQRWDEDQKDMTYEKIRARATPSTRRT